jgi:hypothetical protein
MSEIGVYDSMSGYYVGVQMTTVSGATVMGEWIAVATLVPRPLSEIVITPRADSIIAAWRSPRAFTVAAFVDGAWVSVLQRSGITDWTTASKRFKFDTVVTSSRYRLIVTEVGNLTFDSDGQDRIKVAEIEYFDELAYVVTKLDVLEQRIADLVNKLYGVTNLEDAPE